MRCFITYRNTLVQDLRVRLDSKPDKPAPQQHRYEVSYAWDGRRTHVRKTHEDFKRLHAHLQAHWSRALLGSRAPAFPTCKAGVSSMLVCGFLVLDYFKLFAELC